MRNHSWVYETAYESPDDSEVVQHLGSRVYRFYAAGDQYVVESYEKIAEIAAKYEMLDYHGAFKPAGIAVWPNLINYEGVQGTEQHK